MAQQEGQIWNHDPLVSDFAAHFRSFDAERGQLRRTLAVQDYEMQSLITKVASHLPEELKEGDWRSRLAHALVVQCIGKGKGLRIETFPGGGISFEDGMGGSSNQLNPLLRRVAEASQTFTPDAASRASCKVLSDRAATLERELQQASQTAYALAETASLSSDCRYLQSAN